MSVEPPSHSTNSAQCTTTYYTQAVLEPHPLPPYRKKANILVSAICLFYSITYVIRVWLIVLRPKSL